jgi:hypothetical protein
MQKFIIRARPKEVVLFLFKHLVADAVKFAGPGDTTVVDNLDPGFASDNWYDRGFLDMQDEDPVYHAAYSKVPFFVSSGCEVGDYMGCCLFHAGFKTKKTNKHA